MLTDGNEVLLTGFVDAGNGNFTAVFFSTIVSAAGFANGNKALWNPVTLALGLNEVYRVPMRHLKRAFNDHAFLREWRDNRQNSLNLPGV